MKLQLNKKSQIIAVALVIFTVFVGLSCAAAADVDAGSQMAPNNNILKMSAKFTSGTGFHWEVAPETHGVTFMGNKFVQDHPKAIGTSGTLYFSFLKQSPDYYVKLNYMSPCGEIIKSVDSDMLN